MTFNFSNPTKPDSIIKLVLVWDGASYHRSQEFRDFLAQVNQKVTELFTQR